MVPRKQPMWSTQISDSFSNPKPLNPKPLNPKSLTSARTHKGRLIESLFALNSGYLEYMLIRGYLGGLGEPLNPKPQARP